MATGASPPSTRCPARIRQSVPSVRSSSFRLPITCPCLTSSSSSSSSARQLIEQVKSKQSIFFLDVNPLCYDGAKPSLGSFAFWVRLFLSKVSLQSPVIAVLDGENGNEYRRNMLPSYKGNIIYKHGASNGWLSRSEPQVVELLRKLNVPVVKVKGYEADDTVATLTDQALRNGYRVTIGSPDKDFKQLISDEVQIAMPIPELKRWCFYFLKHYIEQYGCDPTSDLSLRCFMGDDVDGVPGIQKLVPAFGRKTATKLLKKHGTLENLLNAASIRIVGRDYAQNTLIQHADFLRKNYQVLSLRRDADVRLEEKWLEERDCRNDSLVLNNFVQKLNKGKRVVKRSWEAVKKAS